MAVELALALEKRFGVTVPPMLINENPSLERIADRLLASLGGERGEDDATRELVEAIASNYADAEILTDVGALVEQVREAARQRNKVDRMSGDASNAKHGLTESARAGLLARFRGRRPAEDAPSPRRQAESKVPEEFPASTATPSMRVS